MKHDFPFNHFLNLKAQGASLHQLSLNFQEKREKAEAEKDDEEPQDTLPFLSELQKQNEGGEKKKKTGPNGSPFLTLPTETSEIKFEENLLGSLSTSDNQNHLDEAKDDELKELQLINQEILSYLKNLIHPQKFSAYFSDTIKITKIDEKLIEFSVTTNFIKKMIENHYLPQLTESIFNTLGKPYSIVLNLIALKKNTSQTNNFLGLLANENKNFPEEKPKRIDKKVKNKKVFHNAKDARFTIDLIPSQEDLLNQVDSTVITHLEDTFHSTLVDPNKTFENFIVGPSNNMAYASAQAVTKTPGKVFPCLYLHGDSGLGKTHLLNAVVNRIRSHHPHLRLCLTTGREFMTEMVNAMANKKISEFRKKYSEQVDVLMIDDIHELKNKTGTQNEFFHIFNELHNKGKQLIFTSDKSPKEIDGLEERIKTRLSWGLVLDVQKPEIETRIAILKKKALQEDIYLPDDVVNLIATSCKENIRELEGSLIRLAAYSSVMHVDIDLEVAKEQLKMNEQQEETSTDLDTIAKYISYHFKIPIPDIRSKVRRKDVTLARHVAMYMAYKIMQLTLSEIGQYFGNRDHTSVLHAVLKIDKTLESNGELLEVVNEVKNRLLNK